MLIAALLVQIPGPRRKNVVKSARPLLVVALLAVLAACSQSKTEPAVTPVAALPEAPPPMMSPSIAPPAEPYIARSAPRGHHKVVKRVVRERKVVKRTHAKSVKVAAKHHHKKKHHAKTAHNAGHAKHAPTRLASRAKPAPVSVPLDSPAAVTRPSAGAAGPLTPGLR
jgi:hypothetical protein